ncbi:MAG: glycosyl transferase family 36, partial [Planctomycetota bacterium]
MLPRANRAARSRITRYGRFAEDGREYIITDPRPPRPWCNVISNRRLGLAVSHTGSGFTWIDNSQLAVITRWEQDLARDSSGKFLYVRDEDADAIWSLSPAPVWSADATYACRHGLGYTTFECCARSIRARWTLYCHATDTIELWSVALENLSDRPRTLELTALLEWCCGVAPSPRREFHKLFIETEYDVHDGVVYARNHMWDVPNPRFGHWNTDFPYVAGLACSAPVTDATGDKVAFLGRYASFAAPVALRDERWSPQFGRHDDPIAALRSRITIQPGQTERIVYGLAVGETHARCRELVDAHVSPPAAEAALEEVTSEWRARLDAHRVETPDDSI